MMRTTNPINYTMLMQIPTFEERVKALFLHGKVGELSGSDRIFMQDFYHSREWKEFRKKVIVRDAGCDLAMEGFEIFKGIIIHHINPISYRDLLDRNPSIFDLDNVVCVSHNTHEAIHYGDESLLSMLPVERIANDTIPWKN